MNNYLANTLVNYFFKQLLVLVLFLSGESFGQAKLTPKNIVNKDVSTAIEIRDSIINSTIPATGNESKYWYKFTAAKDTILIFDIVPFNPIHDYDFVLYEYATSDVEIKNRQLKAVRSCYSINYDKFGSTGLSLSATQEVLKGGPGYGYVTTFPVKGGETYYIMVHWVYANSFQKGFKLYLNNLWPNKPKRLITKPVVKPREIVLENVLFDTNKSTLLKESYAPLDLLVNQLASQKTMIIQIKGHTDNSGDELKNRELSEKRAKAVFDYLVSKNISKSRLTYYGIGGKEPITTNDTEEGRKKNRRVAFVVVTK
jgi:outer membrane protein OmpA-like peptidoglycan-associated protein